MTKCYHICFTSHNEVMFRNNIDYIFGIFSMVLASIRTHTIILAFALMSDLGMIHRNSVSDIPNNYRFDENGTLIFSDFVDVTFVENHYVSGRRFSYYMTRPSNEVCELIDQTYFPIYGAESYVQLNLAQKEEIAKDILSRYYAGKKQLQRCLSITLKS